MPDSTIYPGGGGDWTTIASWESWADGEATADQTALVDASGDAGGNVTISGWVTTPTSGSHPTIRAEDQYGDYATATQSTATGRARATHATSFVIRFREPYVTVEGMYLQNAGSSTTLNINTQGNQTIRKNFIEHDGTRGAVEIDQTGNTIEDNVIWTTDDGVKADVDGSGDRVANNTIYGKSGAAVGVAVRTGYAIYSNYVGGGFSDHWNVVNAGATGDYNAQDGTDADIVGANSIDSAAAADQFTDAANGDFTLKSGSDLEDAGDPSNSTSDSIIGTTRTTPDIGADEFVSAGGATVLPHPWVRQPIYRM